MLEYLILYIFFGCISMIGSLADDANKEKVRRIQNVVCFVAVFLLLACRHQSMGIDLAWKGKSADAGYLPFFDWVANNLYRPFSEFYAIISKDFNFERGFSVYLWLVAHISRKRQVFMAITAFISIFPIAYLFDRKSKDPVLSWVIYMALSPFLLLYSGLRQSMAIGLAALMFLFAEDKRWYLFLFSGVLAFSLHKSAALLVLIIPLFYFKIGEKLRVLSVAAFAVLFVFMDRIVGLILDVYPQYEYMFSNEEVGAYRFFMVLVMIYIVCVMGTDGSMTQNAYMNLFYLSCALQLFGMVSNVAARAGFYFMNALCILLPDVIDNMKIKENSSLLKLGTAFCFSLWGLYCIYSSGWPMAYPYYWFWEAVA